MPEPAVPSSQEEHIVRLVSPPFDEAARTLPRLLTSFIGREADIAAVLRLIGRNDVRLVTLTGPGGVGKTRLAIQVAGKLATFTEGLWFVPLASISEPDQVVPAIVNATGADRSPNRSALKNLIVYLRDASALIILDNFEQVLAAAPALAEILSGCPGLKMLVTSRFGLNVAPEHVYAVSTLEVPDEDTTTGPETLFEHEAVRLFVERARSRRPDFELTERNGPAVAAICRRLDGLPLGIELAAARLTVLSPRDLLARLDARLGVLTEGAHDQPGRLRSLRASIAWSYDLLLPEEQTLFRRLGAFAGQWTLAAAEAVATDPGDTPPLPILDGVASLVEKSLVRHQVMPDGTSKYQLLETILEFAAELLHASDEADAVRDRLTAYLMSLADGLVLSWLLPDGAERCARVEVHLADLWAALARTERQGDVEALGRLAGSLAILQMRGHYHDSRRWLERAVELGRAAGTPILGRLLSSLSAIHYAAGDEDGAWPLALEALSLLNVKGDRLYQCVALMRCAMIAQRRDAMVESERYHRRALDVIEAMPPEPWLLYARSSLLVNLGNNAVQRGAILAAREYFERAIGIQAGLGHEPGTGYLGANHALAGMGDVERAEGDHEAALRHFQRSLEFARRVNDYRGAIYAIGGIAASLACAGQWQLAARLFGADEQLHQRMGIDFDVETRDRQRGLGLPEPWFRGDEPFNSGSHIRGALWKDTPPTYHPIPDPEAAAELWRAGRALTLDEAVAEAMAATVTSHAVNTGWHGLSPREVEVLRLIVAGKSDAQIGEALLVSRRTAATHAQHIYDKLGVSSRAAAAVWAVRNGLS